MSDEQQPDQGAEPPRLGPRPLLVPAVDAGAREAFGRPEGVDGSFEPKLNGATKRTETAPPPHHALASAFGRPTGAGDLQRPPNTNGHKRSEDPFWAGGSARDPWRDPESSVQLGPPKVLEPPSNAGPPREGALLSAREVLFGKRVKPVSLALLAVVALLIGAVGGLVGKWASDSSAALTQPGASIAQVSPGKERPPGSVANIAAKVLPSVVSIQLRVGDQGGTGSGVVIDKDGHILTNNHVVSPAVGVEGATVKAAFQDGTQVPAQVVGRDPKTDLAVLKVNVPGVVAAQIGDSSNIAVGDSVIAIGSPLGLAGTVTEGIISALHRPVRLGGEGTDTSAVIDAIQTDTAINPGNSGGPLVDSTGAVIGLNAAIRTSGPGEGGSIGLGFALPINYARKIAEQLMRTGSVQHPDLGVDAKGKTDGTRDGAEVQNVHPGSAAAEAGIVEGDVIVKLGNRVVQSSNELEVAVEEHAIGEKVEVQLVRQGRPLTVTATLKTD
ncbi:MAG TPA: trypsin-like peptidase domain-containing protein [Pseudonocardia sp.]|nr:trypsin-like peptidase domain-containing protein [Pseudonocardia sp.]